MKRGHWIIALTLLIAILLFSGGVVANHYVKMNLQKKLVNDYAQQEAVIGHEIAGTLTNRVQTIQNTLTAVALAKDIQSTDPNVCNPTVDEAIKTLQINVGNIGRVNAQGIFYCSGNKALLGVPASKLGTYVQQLIDDPNHKPVVIEVIISSGAADRHPRADRVVGSLWSGNNSLSTENLRSSRSDRS